LHGTPGANVGPHGTTNILPGGNVGPHGATNIPPGGNVGPHGVTNIPPGGNVGPHSVTNIPGLQRNGNIGVRPQAGGFHDPRLPAPMAGAVDRRTQVGAIRMRPNGTVSHVYNEQRGFNIQHTLRGGTHVAYEPPGQPGLRVVAERNGFVNGGYVQRPFVFRGASLARRTYVVGGISYDRFYVRHASGLEVYTPVRYYPVGFYQWAAYGVPLVVLSEFVLAQSLKESNAPQALQPPQQVRQEVASEVQQDVLQEQAAAGRSQGAGFSDPTDVSVLLADNRAHYFVSGHDLDLQDDSGRECQISEGDVLGVQGAPTGSAVAAAIMWSKGGAECAASTVVQVDINDLQEMHNHMRETMEVGMARLQEKQGQGGLPSAPPDAMGQPAQAAFVPEAPAHDANAASEINGTLNQSATAEQEVKGSPGV
jgi:hypothetical protein